MVKVSVLLPVYNGERYVRRAIESVLSQTYQDFELIIVNDGSTDRTAEIVNEYVVYDGTWVFHTENQGVTKALTLALKSAAGKYVTFISHDDWWLPHKLATEVKTLDGCSKRFGVAYSNFYQYLEEAKQVKPIFAPATAQDDILHSCGINISSAILRRSTLLQLQKRDGYILDQSLKDCIDWDLWIRLSQLCHFKHIPQLLSYYSIHRQQMTRGFNHGLVKVKVYLRYNHFSLYFIRYFLESVFRAQLRHLLGRPYK